MIRYPEAFLQQKNSNPVSRIHRWNELKKEMREIICSLSVPLEGVEDILVDHVAAGVVEAAALCLLLDISHGREFHGDAGHMAEHLLKFNLLCMHEQCIRDLSRAEFLTLAAVDAGVCNVGKPDEVEHEVRRELPGRTLIPLRRPAGQVGDFVRIPRSAGMPKAPHNLGKRKRGENFRDLYIEDTLHKMSDSMIIMSDLAHSLNRINEVDFF
jgi:hypothetical protein